MRYRQLLKHRIAVKRLQPITRDPALAIEPLRVSPSSCARGLGTVAVDGLGCPRCRLLPTPDLARGIHGDAAREVDAVRTTGARGREAHCSSRRVLRPTHFQPTHPRATV